LSNAEQRAVGLIPAWSPATLTKATGDLNPFGYAKTLDLIVEYVFQLEAYI